MEAAGSESGGGRKAQLPGEEVATTPPPVYLSEMAKLGPDTLPSQFVDPSLP
jgi:hypothetical protein